MCRIDESFGPHSLEEKKDPTEKFLQALDESEAFGDFRDLLERRFASTWSRELGRLESIQKALKASQDAVDLAGKVSLFVQTLSDNNLGNWFLYAYSGSFDDSMREHAKSVILADSHLLRKSPRQSFPNHPLVFTSASKTQSVFVLTSLSCFTLLFIMVRTVI